MFARGADGCARFLSYGVLPSVPISPAELLNATWRELVPLYDQLLEHPLDHATLREWLACWSALDDTVDEAYGLALLAYTGDTRDEKAEETYRRWSTEISPSLHEARVNLGKRLIPFRDALPDLSLLVREIETDIRVFRHENLPRMAELESMETTYDKITGGLSVEWEGETKTVPELQPFLFDQRREIREAAFRKAAAAYIEKRDELADLFDRMVRVRHALAREAGFANYRDYAFTAKYRFDYTPDDCLRFHEAVAASVLPALGRLHALRREQLGVPALRPWDLQLRPGRTERLVPFATADEFLSGSRRIFDSIDPELGSFFDTMVGERLVDLESRQGKAPGGYCTRLPKRGVPFIFMNAVGVHDDVNTLVHEAGHAFHTFLTRGIPYTWQHATGHEAAELASMSMELLAASRLARPTGFYSETDAADAQIEHLEDILMGLPHIASVDAFQHWIYTDGLDASPADRDTRWLEIRARFEPDVDYSGLEPERISRWYRQSHIHTAPFYYIEYGLAQLGALQVWSASRGDGATAIIRYKRALSLGGTRSLPDIYETAGASLVFDAATMSSLVRAVEERLAELRIPRLSS
jgi:oligoendopeptidase F